MAIISSMKIKGSSGFSDKIPLGTTSDYISHQNCNLKSILGDISLLENTSICDTLNTLKGNGLATFSEVSDIEEEQKIINFDNYTTDGDYFLQLDGNDKDKYFDMTSNLPVLNHFSGFKKGVDSNILLSVKTVISSLGPKACEQVLVINDCWYRRLGIGTTTTVDEVETTTYSFGKWSYLQYAGIDYDVDNINNGYGFAEIYVDAVNGNDLNCGCDADNAKKTIPHIIASEANVVRVLYLNLKAGDYELSSGNAIEWRDFTIVKVEALEGGVNLICRPSKRPPNAETADRRYYMKGNVLNFQGPREATSESDYMKITVYDSQDAVTENDVTTDVENPECHIMLEGVLRFYADRIYLDTAYLLTKQSNIEFSNSVMSCINCNNGSHAILTNMHYNASKRSGTSDSYLGVAQLIAQRSSQVYLSGTQTFDGFVGNYIYGYVMIARTGGELVIDNGTTFPKLPTSNYKYTLRSYDGGKMTMSRTLYRTYFKGKTNYILGPVFLTDYGYYLGYLGSMGYISKL